MSNLTIKTQSDLLAFLQDNLSDGKNLSIRGVAALCETQHTSIIRGGAFNSEKLGQILTEQGFEAGALERKGFNAKATWLVIEYFAYESKARAEGAKQIARTFGQLGVQLTFDKLVEVKIVEQPKPIETKLMVANELRLLNESTLPAAVKQLLIDSLMNEYITTNQPVLEASKERWVGCVQKAEEMGYATNQSDRAKLGKFVKGNSEDLVIKQEERLCNGMMRSIWVYLDSPELEVVIHDYFNPEVY